MVKIFDFVLARCVSVKLLLVHCHLQLRPRAPEKHRFLALLTLPLLRYFVPLYSWGILQYEGPENVYLRKRLLPEGGQEVPGARAEPLVLRPQPVRPRIHHFHLLSGLLQLLKHHKNHLLNIILVFNSVVLLSDHHFVSPLRG